MPTSSSDAKYILVSDHLTKRERDAGMAYKNVGPDARKSYKTRDEAMVAARQYLRDFRSMKPHQGVFICEVGLKITP